MPSGSQQSSSSGDNAFCCLKTRHSKECTATKDQVNVCWSTVDNPVANLSDTKLNETFSSLSSAKPSASSYPISLAQLQATATPTTSLPASLSASSLFSVSATTTSSASSTSGESTEKKGISSGAIGGIVGGVVGGLAIIGLVGLLLFRRRKANTKGEHAPIASGTPSEHEHGNPYEMNAFQQQNAGMVDAPSPGEKYAYNSGADSTGPASPYRDVPGVQGNAVERPVAYEMPASGPVEMDGSASARR
ncbi:hypothetical protein EJ07DRAFT_155576 [Lizonia empirigonia]|nr:hypothetical protein EJ07DRAFT_155576 [Lizonia empirigonia]